MDDDLLSFADESPSVDAGRSRDSTWKVLIVDDEPEVHDVTTLALDDFEFAGRKLEFIHAYSAVEAIALLEEHQDTAVMLLDVVMETEYAGLGVVRFVREKLGNKFVRIILRTGQPGQAPEHKVITEFDINDYKHKTELTQQKLFTVVYTSISSYRDLMALDANRRGLRKIIEASNKLLEQHSLDTFAQGVLEQLAALLYLDSDAMVLHVEGLAAEKQSDAIQILAAIGGFREFVGADAKTVLQATVLQRIQKTLAARDSHFGTDYVCAFYETAAGRCNVFYVAGCNEITEPDRELIELFCRSAAVTHDTVALIDRD